MANITISKEALWAMISSMSQDNQRWAADKLIEKTSERKKKRCGLDEALDGVKEGRVTQYASADDFFKKMGI